VAFLWPLATPAGRIYLDMLTANWRLALEAWAGLSLGAIWGARRLGELFFLRVSGRRLQAASGR
jgi:hypothetical protein